MNPFIKKFLNGCAHFWPQPILSSRRERLAGCVGAGIGLILTAWLCHHALGDSSPWLIAPMGASAVLMFAIPASPLAQPWAIVGGNLLAAVIGVTCAYCLSDTALAAGLAVALSIALMFPLRCLHPPSGAVAVTAVLGGPAIAQVVYGFALYPGLINSLLLTAVALVFNNAVKRRYPHSMSSAKAVPVAVNLPQPGVRQRRGIHREDLHAVLVERGEVLDIDEGDLLEILTQAEARAQRRATTKSA